MPRSPDPASRRQFLKGSGGAAALLSVPIPAAAQGGADDGVLLPAMFGATGDGSTDDGPALQRAVTAALGSGRPFFVPAGSYRVEQPIRISAAATEGAFARGIRLTGAGPGRTIFQAENEGSPLFDIDAEAPPGEFRALLSCLLEGFTIRGRGDGLRIRRAYNVRLRDLHIAGLNGTGIQLVCEQGDLDGANMIALDQVRIDDCAGWGIDAAAAPGRNEISFLKLEQVFIQRCGRRTAGVPDSGGLRWKGQICTLHQCAFTLNENVALFIPGQPGLAQTIEIRSTAFENNCGRHILCSGVSMFKARNVQFYNDDRFTAGVSCDFSGREFAIRMVDIDGVTVRAAPANRPHTAFRIGGPHAEVERCRVRNVSWEDFDHLGQSRFEGFLFDHVVQSCRLRAGGPGELVFGPDSEGRGNRTPLRLGAASASGEWVEGILIGGLAARPQGLAAAQRYAVYLFDDRNSKRLEVVAEEPVLDPVSGYRVRPANASRLFVGWLNTDRDGRFTVGD